MFQSRDEVRKVYTDVWNKLNKGEILEPMESMIADIIQLHPEYHQLLGDIETAQQSEFNPEMGQSNPFLHMGMHIALREQVSIDRPSGIKLIHQNLSNKKGLHDAEHSMIECLAQALWLAQQNQSMPDESAYLECLQKI